MPTLIATINKIGGIRVELPSRTATSAAVLRLPGVKDFGTSFDGSTRSVYVPAEQKAVLWSILKANLSGWTLRLTTIHTGEIREFIIGFVKCATCAGEVEHGLHDTLDGQTYCPPCAEVKQPGMVIPHRCTGCKGEGWITRPDFDVAWLREVISCRTCAGTGELIEYIHPKTLMAAVGF